MLACQHRERKFNLNTNFNQEAAPSFNTNTWQMIEHYTLLSSLLNVKILKPFFHHRSLFPWKLQETKFFSGPDTNMWPGFLLFSGRVTQSCCTVQILWWDIDNWIFLEQNKVECQKKKEKENPNIQKKILQKYPLEEKKKYVLLTPG